MTASYHENLHAELLQAFDKAHLRLWSAENLQCIPYRFFPASRFLPMFYFFLRFQHFSQSLWGHVSYCCGKMLESSVHPCFSHLQEDFWVKLICCQGYQSATPDSKRFPGDRFGCEGNQQRYDSRGGFLSKIRWLIECHVKTIQIFGTTTILLHILYMYIYIYTLKKSCFVRFENQIPNSRNFPPNPRATPIQLFHRNDRGEFPCTSTTRSCQRTVSIGSGLTQRL